MITRALQIRGSNRMGQPGVTKDSNGSAANALLKGAIMMAPEAVGNPSNRGKGESAGYFKWLAIREPRTFSMLFLRILPLQIGRLTDPTARALVQAIMMAPEAVGDPSNRGKGGAAGYFKWLATREPRTFSMLLLQILPLQMIEGDITYENVHEKLLERINRILQNSERARSESSADRGHIDTTVPQAGIDQNALPGGDARPQRDAELEGGSAPAKTDQRILIVG
jgi:hypothetical protein